MTQKYYGTNAYNSQTFQPTDGDCNRPDERAVWLPPLGSEVLQRVPFSFFTQYTPYHMRRFAKKNTAPEWFKDERYGAINEHCLRPVSVSKFGGLILAGERIGKILTIFSGIISIFSILMIMTKRPISQILDNMLVDYILVGSPLTLWLTCWLIYKIFPIKHGIGSPWELNRQTGMVSIFTYNKRKPKEPPLITSVPFTEMDAFVIPILGRFGYTFLLTLTHRYSDLTIRAGDIIGAVTHMTYHEALWDFIQNYMDTSQPLPDITLFEEFRSKDPTTAKHDQQSGRDPNYWLNMSDKEWQHQQTHNPLILLS